MVINAELVGQHELAAVANNGTVMEMVAKLEEMKQKLQLVKKFFREVMEKDVDYGIIPGTDKPALYQPGADKINSLYGFSKVIANKDENRDYVTGHYDATVKVQLVHRGSGVLVAEGEGSCSTWESKYRYRWIYEGDIPKGVNPADLVSKDYENKTTRAKWTKYRIDNEDLYSLWNTVLKMATKRAYVAATLAATGLSGVFAQEEDELEAWIEGEAVVEHDDQNAHRNGNGASDIDKRDLSVTVSFGKFKGKTLGHILDEDPSYLEWLANNAQADKVRKACANILRVTGTATQQQSRPQPSAGEHDEVPPPTDDDAPPAEPVYGGGEPV